MTGRPDGERNSQKARAERGKPRVLLSLTAEAADALTEIAERTGETRSAVVCRLLVASRRRLRTRPA